MINKKAILGSLTTTFIATILIVLILIVYGFASGVIKAVDFSGGTKIESLGRSVNGYLNINEAYLDMNRIVNSEYEIKGNDVGFYVLMNHFNKLQGEKIFPEIIKVNIGKGEIDFDKKEVIIKELSGIEDLGNFKSERVLYLYPGIKFIFKFI